MAWVISFAMQFAIGALAFYLTQTMAIANLQFALFSLFSGYLMPLDLFHPVAVIARWLPFRYILAVPVELMTKPITHDHLARLLAAQAAWTAIMLATALAVWHAGIKRFESVGG